VVVLRVVFAQENLSFHLKKGPTSYLSACKRTTIFKGDWSRAWFRACQTLLSRPQSAGESPQASLLHPGNAFPEYLLRPGKVGNLSAEAVVTP